MIANFFQKSKPINALIIVFLLFTIYTISTFVNLTNEVTLYFIVKRFSYFLLLLVVLFTVNFIITKNNLTKDNSYALLLFVLMLGMFPFSVVDFKLIAINFILLIAYRRIYSLRTNKNTEEKLFDSAFCIGIATLLYGWSFLLILLIYVALFLFDKGTWRNTLIPIVGLICPIFIYGVYLIAIDDFTFFETLLNFDFSLSFTNYNSFKILTPISFIAGLIIWSVFPASFKISSINNEFKHSWFLLVNHFLILLPITLLWPHKNGSEFIFLFFPIAVILTNYLQIVEEKWFREVFLYCFLALTGVIYFL